jgi:hypothetical protein
MGRRKKEQKTDVRYEVCTAEKIWIMVFWIDTV